MVIKLVKKKTGIKKSVKKKASKSTSKSKKVVISNADLSQSYVIIDYPNEAEVINGFHYAIRIGASYDGYAEISFNDGEWFPCRFDSGYWWFDWMDFVPGMHVLSARLVNPQGDVITESNKRKCKVC